MTPLHLRTALTLAVALRLILLLAGHRRGRPRLAAVTATLLLILLAAVTAAATRRRPRSSFAASGYFTAFSMSFTVIRPMQR